jgi:hypothetical protein
VKASAEEAEKYEEADRHKELQGFLKQQSDAKMRKAEEEFRREQENSTKAQALLDQQEKNFYQYAEQAVKNWGEQGKEVKPLILELKNYKKKIA